MAHVLEIAMLCCTVLAIAASAGASAAPVDPFANLGWLQGCWVPDTANAEVGTVETWTSAAGGVMLGMRRTVKNRRATEFEFIQIREIEAGKLAFIAQPSGRPPTTFPLARRTDTEFVFEQSSHEFPQRVIYRRDGAKLVARIEGTVNGKLHSIGFPMKRTSCDPAQI